MVKLISPGKNLGHSTLYIDFVLNKEITRSFFPSSDLSKVALQLDTKSYDRQKLSQILKKQNELFGAGNKSLENIKKLNQPDTVTIFSGQQAVLFGGPLLIQIKAFTLVKTAAEYSKKLSRPVIPIFWIAGDDHDFEEINHVSLLNKQSEEVTIKYDAPPQFELPASELTFENQEELNKAKSAYNESLGETEFTPRLYELIDSSYQVGETFVSAFAKLLSALASDHGLVLFDPGDIEVKKLAVPFFKNLLDKQNELHSVTNQTNKTILGKGYHLQVQKTEGATHLFYNLNGRKPVLRTGNDFTVGDKTFSKTELIEKIEKEAERFSPDVLTRPVFQSYLFPVLSQRGGPAEIAYLAQSAPIFKLFDLPVPVYKTRPSITFIEKHFEKMMDDYKISFKDLTGDIELVVNDVLARSFPENLDKTMADIKNNIEKQFTFLKEKSLDFDPSLKDFANQTFGKIDFALKNFESKLFTSHKKKSQDIRNRLYRLWHALFPAKALQERSLNFGYFVSKYGFDFVKFMHDGIDIDETSHQLISMSEYKST
jgi:bacillithiol biosynthesis cysteine-adding enzyme BshC